jgi:hypothetical protein
MALHPFHHAILKVICDYGIVTTSAIERALLFARPPVVSGYTSDALFDSLMLLLNGDYIAYEQLQGDVTAFSLAPGGCQALGRPARPLPARPEDRWAKTLEADLRVTVAALNAQLTLTLDPHRAKICSWYQNQHFQYDRSKYLDPTEPTRAPGMGEKVWSLTLFEHKRECVVRQIFREQICSGVIKWFDGMAAEIATAVETPRYFVVGPNGRPVAVLFRTKVTLPRIWQRQMKALARLDKVLVLPDADLVEQYDEQTEGDLEAPAFEGGTRLMPRKIDIIPQYRFFGVLERLVS